MTTDYISRETAIAKLTALEIEKPGATMADARRALWNMSGERVAEVIHGRWVDNGIPGPMLSGCSVCGFTCGSSSFFYCPNCGAKMDWERLYPPDGPGADDPGPPGELGPIDGETAGKQ